MYQAPLTAASEPVPAAAVRLVRLSAALHRVVVGVALTALGVFVLSSADASASHMTGGALLLTGPLVVLWRDVQLSRLLTGVLNAAVLLIAADTVRYLITA